MRVLHIIPTLRKGGAERIALDICIELQKRKGVEVLLVTLHEDNDYPTLSAKVNCVVCNSKYITSIKGKHQVDLVQLQNVVDEFKPAIIHSHLFEAEIVSRNLNAKGVKFITHCHDNMYQFNNLSFCKSPKKNSLTNWYEKKLLVKLYKKCNNIFIANSIDTANFYKKSLPNKMTKTIFIIDNAINFNSFYNPNKRKLAEPVHLINVGSFVKKKNQDFLIDVIKLLNSRGVPSTLTLLGDGPLRSSVQDNVKKANLEAQVELPGNVENVQDYLNKSTIYVHSATYEPFGLVQVEAMAAGLPVVALDGKGNRELIQNGSNGFMVSKVDPIDFAEKIIKIIENNQTYLTFSKKSIDFAKKYDIVNYVDELLKNYNQ